MRNAYIVSPGAAEPVEIVNFKKLPSGNYWLTLRCGFREYGRIVTRLGLAAVRREAIAVMVLSEREVA